MRHDSVMRRGLLISRAVNKPLTYGSQCSGFQRGKAREKRKGRELPLYRDGALENFTVLIYIKWGPFSQTAPVYRPVVTVSYWILIELILSSHQPPLIFWIESDRPDRVNTLLLPAKLTCS